MYANTSQLMQMQEIHSQLKNNVLISHIINIQISDEPKNKDLAHQLRKEISKRLNNVQLLENVLHNGIVFPVAITWLMSISADTNCLFYAVNIPFVDSIIASHTNKILKNICLSIQTMFPHFGHEWDVTYMITKPLTYLSPISDGKSNL